MGWLFRDCHPIASTRKYASSHSWLSGRIGYFHFLAYGAVGSTYALAYCSTLARVVSGLILTAGAALLEGPQSFVPDRTPELADILGSSAGAWIGLGFAFLAAIAISRLARR